MLEANILTYIGYWLIIDGVGSMIFFMGTGGFKAQLIRIIRTALGLFMAFG